MHLSTPSVKPLVLHKHRLFFTFSGVQKGRCFVFPQCLSGEVYREKCRQDSKLGEKRYSPITIAAARHCSKNAQVGKEFSVTVILPKDGIKKSIFQGQKVLIDLGKATKSESSSSSTQPTEPQKPGAPGEPTQQSQHLAVARQAFVRAVFGGRR